MWRSPSNCELQLTPRQIGGLTFMLDRDLEHFNYGDQTLPWFMTEEPCYRQLPARVLLWEAIKVLETLVTDGPMPDGAPHAVSECVLHGLAMSLYHQGVFSEDCSSAAERKVFKHGFLDPINALRRQAGQRPLKTLARLDEDSWGETLDDLFFFDRDWEMFSGELQPAMQGNHGNILETLGIPDDYFTPALRQPTKAEWANAQARFRAIWQWGEKHAGYLPAGALDNLPKGS